ncbi:MAG: nitrous oxide reductase accessory protein NosL, partial [Alphaproteobacteria bacterium]
PTWQATLVFADGQRLVFDGPKDLFRYLQEPSLRLPGRSPAEVRQVWVTEYYSATPIPARDVFFIAGSDVMGPMGAELVPVKGRKQAETFMRDHGGRRVMVFDGLELKPVD